MSGTQPFAEPRLIYCQLVRNETNPEHMNQNTQLVSQENAFA